MLSFFNSFSYFISSSFIKISTSYKTFYGTFSNKTTIFISKYIINSLNKHIHFIHKMIIKCKFSLINSIFRSTNHKYFRSVRTNTHRIYSTIHISYVSSSSIFITLYSTIIKCYILSNKKVYFRHFIINSAYSIIGIFNSIKKCIPKNIFSIGVNIYSRRSFNKHSFTSRNNYTIFIFKTKENRIIAILIFFTIFSTLKYIISKSFKSSFTIFRSF